MWAQNERVCHEGHGVTEKQFQKLRELHPYAFVLASASPLPEDLADLLSGRTTEERQESLKERTVLVPTREVVEVGLLKNRLYLVDCNTASADAVKEAAKEPSLAGKEKNGKLEKETVPNWFPILGAIFTLFFVGSLFYLLIAPRELSSGRHIIFDVWVAICLAASASFLGGTAKAHGSLPWPAWLGGGSPPIQFATGGGIATFIIALIILLGAYH